jgi:hypothetical protein
MHSEEELQAKGFTAVDEFAWDDIDVLRPGTDYKNGITYLTVPMMLNNLKTVGKGKGAKEEFVKELGIGCITSERRHFKYTKERVEAKGFNYPRTVVQPEKSRWSKESMKSFLSGEYTEPDPVALFTGIRTVYEEYIEFADQEYYDMMPLFIMGSYMFRLFSAIGYVHFNGTAASGKSQNLNIIDALGFNTIWSSSMSEASLFRTIAGNPGVVCVDEAEGFDGERGENLRRILNAGYLDGSTATRTEKGANDSFVVVPYEVYGPKAIASINPLDMVLGSRCVIVAMRPALRVIPGFERSNPRWPVIRDRLYLWMMLNQAKIKGLVDQWNELTRFERAKDLRSRQWQITQSYIVLADYLDRHDGGTRCERLIAFFTAYFSAREKQADATDRIRLVLRTLPRVLSTVHPYDEHFYPLKTIHEVVSQYLEDDAKEYFKTRTLSKYLDVLGFKTRRPHKQGQQIWLTEEDVRQEFLQRRVETEPEDAAWLRGEVQYRMTPAAEATGIPKSTDDLWASMADEEEVNF